MSDDDAPEPRLPAHARKESGEQHEEKLNDALNDLEQMLARHHVVEPEDGHPPVELPPSAEETVGGGDDDGQLDIPLLDDVVVPGRELDAQRVAARPTEASTWHSAPADDDTMERVVERLVSELEVIVQTSVDEAIDTARRTLTERIREHLDIILPELLDELAQRHARR